MEIRPSSPDVIIYTDAATSARIAAAVVIEPNLSRPQTNFRRLSEIADPERGAIFCDAALIYGLELLDAAAIFFLMGFLRGKNVTLYVDNSNTRGALVRGYSQTMVIRIAILISRAFAQFSGARFWFEQVPTNRNIAFLPTRMAKLPSNTKALIPFPILNILKEWATKAHEAGEFPPFYERPNRRYSTKLPA